MTDAKCPACGQPVPITAVVPPAETVIDNCRKPGATENELDAAVWIEALLKHGGR